MSGQSAKSKEKRFLEDTFQSSRPWKTLFQIYGSNKWAIVFGQIVAVIKHSPVFIVPLVTAQIIDVISDPVHHGIREFWIPAVIGSVLVLQNPISTYLFQTNLSKIARTAEEALRIAICRRLQQLNISFYKHRSTGALQTKALRDVESIDQMARTILDTAGNCIYNILAALIVTAYRAPEFLPIFFVTIPPVILIRILLFKKIRKANKEFRGEMENLFARISSMIDMIPVARAHVVEDEELSRIKARVEKVKESGMRVDATNAIFVSTSWALLTFLNFAGLLIAAWCSYYQILPLTKGDVVMLGAYFTQISTAILQINGYLPQFTRGFEAVRSIGEILESPDIEQNQGKTQLNDVKGEFIFENVHFSYDSKDNAVAISNFSLHVKAGETMALVGPSGSGKSTLIGLILGFNRATSGRILLDGRDMNSIDLRTYRKRISVVSQDTVLFQGTLRENVIYGCPRVTEELFQQTLRDANVAEFISSLPNGVETVIGERGARLSGGQKQRVAIARALIRNPRVLILDEATSALDVESEFLVQQALDRLIKGRTTFIVAHRLSTIRNADRIAVLENGRMIELGTPQDLLDRQGKFAKMHHLQTTGRKTADI